MGESASTNDSFADDPARHAVIVLGGHPPDRRVLGVLPSSPTVICADSGLDHALRLGLEPHVVIGDMDSVDPSNLSSARARECEILVHPPEKDFTDTELALSYVVDAGFDRVTLLWGGGDRIDHVLGVVAALGHRRLADLDRLDAWIAADRLHVVHAERELRLDHAANTTLSLISIGTGDAVVTTNGLKWNLTDEPIDSTRARGLSNLVESTPCSIRCETGVAAVVVPGALDVHDRTPRS